MKWALLASIPDDVRVGLIIVFPSISRLGMLFTMYVFKYARELGLGTSFQAGAHWWQVGFGFATVVVAAGLLLGIPGFILLGVTIVVSLGIGWWISKLLGGITGGHLRRSQRGRGSCSLAGGDPSVPLESRNLRVSGLDSLCVGGLMEQNVSKKLTLVLGGVRAGKSSYAQRLAACGKRVLFVATAEALDKDMEERIKVHKETRPKAWHTLEEPTDLSNTLPPVLHHYDTVLLDCLTLWVSATCC